MSVFVFLLFGLSSLLRVTALPATMADAVTLKARRDDDRRNLKARRETGTRESKAHVERENASRRGRQICKYAEYGERRGGGRDCESETEENEWQSATGSRTHRE